MTTIPKPSGKVRWIVCGLLFAAVVLSYIDRLVLPTLKPDLQARYGWSESGYADLAIWFQAGYGIAYVAFGRLIDKIERAQMKLRLPGMRPPLPQVIAELRWGLGDDANFSTGWRFAEIDAQTLRIIDAYIADHPQDLIVDPA